MIKKIIAGCFFAAALLVLLSYFLLFTENGFVYLLKGGERLTHGRLQVEQVSGRFGNEFHLAGIFYTSDELSLAVETLTVLWNAKELLRGRLEVTSLITTGVSVDSTPENAGQIDKKSPYVLPDIHLPLALSIEQLEITDVAISENNKPVAQLDNIIASIRSEGDSLLIQKISFRGEGLELELTGNVAIADSWPAAIQGKWKYSPEKGEPIEGSIAVSQSLQHGLVGLEMFSPLKAAADIQYSLEEDINFSSKITVEGADPSVFLESVSGKIDATAFLKGKFAEDGFIADLDVQNIDGMVQGYPIQALGKILYDGRIISFSEMQVMTQRTSLQLDGTVGDEIYVNYSIHSPDLSDVLPDAGGNLTAEGTLEGEFSNPFFEASITGENLTAAGFTIEHLDAQAEGVANATGTVKLGALTRGVHYQEQKIDEIKLDLAGNIENHSIGLNVSRDDVTAELKAAGKIDGSSWQGTVEALRVGGGSQGEMELEKSAALTLEQQSGKIAPLCLIHDSGKICTNGSWTKTGWLAELELLDFNPVIFGDDWSGEIDARFAAAGSIGGSEQVLDVTIEKFSGMLRNLEISAAGSVQQRGDDILFNSIRVAHGDAYVSVDGRLADEYALSFVGEIPDFGTIASQFQGRMTFSGDILGPKDAPAVNFEFSGREGVIDNMVIAEVSGRVNIESGADARVSSEILAKDLTIDAFEIYDASFTLSGSISNHLFDLKTSTSEGVLNVSGIGGYTTFWHGILEEASLVAGRYGNYYLRQKAGVSIYHGKSNLEPLCISGIDLDVCLEGSFAGKDEWRAAVQIDSFSLAQINRYDFIDIPLTGNVEGTFTAEKNTKTGLLVDGRAEISGMELTGDIAGENLQYSLTETSVSLHLADSTLNASIYSGLEKGGSLTGMLTVNEFLQKDKKIEVSPIDGEFSIQLDDLTILSILSRSEIEPSGSLTGNFSFGGTVGKPLVNGDLYLADGAVGFDALGIILTGLTVDINAENEVINFNISAESGTGKASGKGQLTFDKDNQWKMNAQVFGEEFLILNTSEYIIQVNPEVELQLDRHSGQLTGDIVIPHAEIALSGSSSTISPSNDVVIIDAELSQVKNSWQLYSDVRLLLGDDISLSAYGLKSKLTGDLYLRDQPGKTYSAEGKLDVKDGKFTLYSVELDILRGRLLFAGGPVDNPGVDFRAQRIVDKKTVGVDVSGTAQNLEFQLFSDPVMEESNILAYMMVGRSIYASEENEQSLIGAAASALGVRGVNEITSRLGAYLPIDEIYLDGSSSSEDMSLVMGKHITEDLFVGYDHNFFDATGEFRVNFNLGWGFSVETRSSVNSTSGDILYSIEH